MPPFYGSRYFSAVFCGIVAAFLVIASAEKITAQQPDHLYFGVFGVEAPPDRGDHNNMQVIYIEIPEVPGQPVYLRIFDPDTGGLHDESFGGFNTDTRFLLVGGESASKIFGGKTDRSVPPQANLNIPESDIIHDLTIGQNAATDSSYLTLGELPAQRGFLTNDGQRRFVFLAIGMSGDDGNFFDIRLSLNPDENVNPATYRMYAYDLTLKIPANTGFRGQIPVPVKGNKRLSVSTFSLNNAPLSLSIPFLEDQPLQSSQLGEWKTNSVIIPNPAYVEYVGVNVFGRQMTNTFSFAVHDEFGNPVQIPLPIPPFVHSEKPEIQYSYSYAPDNCHLVHLQKHDQDETGLSNSEAIWVIGQDTLRGNRISYHFEEKGYHTYLLNIRGYLNNLQRNVAVLDSVFINTPPRAWAGGDRSFVPGVTMAFDGTVSEDPDGRITHYFWDFGDGNTATGARVDHTYSRPGTYNVTLRVLDNSNSPCNEAIATSTVRINLPPVARIESRGGAAVGDTLWLDASSSFDPDGEITEYFWEIGNETFEGVEVAYPIQNDRDIRIRLTVTDDSYTRNSSASATQTFRFNRLPIANAGADKHVSPGRPATYNANQSRDPDGRIVRYIWTFPDSVIVEGMTVQQGIDTPGDHVVYLTVVDNDGGIGKDSLNVRVNFPPVPVISGNILTTNGRVSLSASESFDPDGRIIRYEWNMGDGSRRITGVDVNHTYRRPGKYNVQLTIADDSGTFSSIQSTRTTVIYNQLPIARITGPETGEPGETLRFDGSRSSDPDGQIIRYVWDFGDGTTVEGDLAEHRFQRPGTYPVRLTVFDDVDHPESKASAMLIVEIEGTPLISARYPSRVAPGSTFEVDLSESQASGELDLEYLWYINGDWETGEIRRSFTMDSDSPKTVRFAVESVDAAGDRYRTEGEAVIAVNHAPVIAGVGNVETHETTLRFNASESYDPDGDPLVFRWVMGDGTILDGSQIEHTYRNGGLFRVELSIDDQQGLANSSISREFQVFINRDAEIAYNLPDLVCLGSTFAFDASSSIDPDGNELRFTWDMGDGTVISGVRGEHRYEAYGHYNVTLTSDDGRNLANSRKSVSDIVHVLASPVARAGNNVTACQGQSVAFDGSASEAFGRDVLRWEWDFGDGNSSLGQTVSHSFNNPGQYKVRLAMECARQGDCAYRSEDEITVTVVPGARASFELPQEHYEGLAIDLDASDIVTEGVEITSLRWEIGNFENIEWTKSTPGVWTGRSSVRGTMAVSLSGGLPLTPWIPEEGTYTVKLSVGTNSPGSCNTAAYSQDITILPRPELAIRAVPMLIPGQEQRFTIDTFGSPSDLIQNPVWDFGTQMKSGLSADMSWDQPGRYLVRLLVSRTNTDGSTSQVVAAEKTVVVNAPPTARISGPTAAMEGDNVRFSGTDSFDPDGEISSYNWQTSDGATYTGPEFSHIFEEGGEYVVSLTVNDGSGLANAVSSTSHEIQIAERVRLRGALPEMVCIADPLNLPRELGLSREQFSTLRVLMDNRPIVYATAVNLIFSQRGSSLFSITRQDGERLLFHEIVIHETPQISARVPEAGVSNSSGSSLLFDASETLRQNGAGTRLLWDFGDGNQASGQVVRHTYTTPGTYEVTLTAIAPHQLECNTSRQTYIVTIR